jgi:hypothetical protein
VTGNNGPDQCRDMKVLRKFEVLKKLIRKNRIIATPP